MRKYRWRHELRPYFDARDMICVVKQQAAAGCVEGVLRENGVDACHCCHHTLVTRRASSAAGVAALPAAAAARPPALDGVHQRRAQLDSDGRVRLISVSSALAGRGAARPLAHQVDELRQLGAVGFPSNFNTRPQPTRPSVACRSRLAETVAREGRQRPRTHVLATPCPVTTALTPHRYLH